MFEYVVLAFCFLWSVEIVPMIGTYHHLIKYYNLKRRTEKCLKK